jgi:protein-tyrosine phosphatase
VIRQRQPAGSSCRIVTMMSFHPGARPDDVPDPYYGGPRGFDTVFELLASSAPALLDAVMKGRSPR